MHRHSADGEHESLRPKAARLEEGLPDHAGRAAAERRPDVLGAEGLLGLQRVAGNAGVSALVEEERSPVHDVIRSGGQPLDADVRGDMEQRLGHDFGDVRVHDDGAAAASARRSTPTRTRSGRTSCSSATTTTPSSQEGKTTLAHELTHVVQQRSGPVDGTAAPGGIKVSDPSDRFEREAAANADRVMAGPTVAPTAVSPSGPAVQRHEAGHEEEAVQGLFVQRQDAGGGRGAGPGPVRPARGRRGRGRSSSGRVTGKGG